MNKVEILVGNLEYKKKILQPFSSDICNFLNTISKEINSLSRSEKTSDLQTASFFCRKSNIEKIKNLKVDTKIRKGLGLIFHITPSNIPTNFFYSLIFGLLCGNSNIVKLPSRNFYEIDILVKIINKVLKKYKKIKSLINIIKYEEKELITEKISLNADARLIWGGDETINKIKKLSTKPGCRDLIFGNRNSLCILNSDSILKLNKIKLLSLVSNFYNDTFSVDQNACSSPHVVFWLGKNIQKAKKIFWHNLSNLIGKKYNYDYDSTVFKYSRIFDDIQKQNVRDIKILSNNLFCISLKKEKIDLNDLIAKWGYFYEFNLSQLKDILYFINPQTQTLTYFGLNKKELELFLIKNNFYGIDRVVPVGQALDIGFEWDGYDIYNHLTKVVDLK